jgi:hypothetical protein
LANGLLLAAKGDKQVGGLTIKEIQDYTKYITIDSDNAKDNSEKLQKMLKFEEDRMRESEKERDKKKEELGEKWYKDKKDKGSVSWRARELIDFEDSQRVAPKVVKSAGVLNSGVKYAQSKANAEDVKNYDSTEIERVLEENPLPPKKMPSVVTFADYISDDTVSSAGWAGVAMKSKGGNRK